MIGALCVIVAGSQVALAQLQGGEYAITRSSIDGGGSTATGGDFSLTGSTGQPDAGSMLSEDRDYVLAGGFWARRNVLELIFEDGFEGR